VFTSSGGANGLWRIGELPNSPRIGVAAGRDLARDKNADQAATTVSATVEATVSSVRHRSAKVNKFFQRIEKSRQLSGHFIGMPVADRQQSACKPVRRSRGKLIVSRALRAAACRHIA
jgi:hypothetical protein